MGDVSPTKEEGEEEEGEEEDDKGGMGDVSPTKGDMGVVSPTKEYDTRDLKKPSSTIKRIPLVPRKVPTK